MTRKLNLILLSLVFINECYYSQNNVALFNQDLSINKSIYDYKYSNTDSIISFISKYHRNIFKNPYLIDFYWTNRSKMNYSLPDYMLKQEFAEYGLNKIKPNLINIFHPDSNYYTAQVGYSYYDTIYKTINLFCVYTFALKYENDSLKFFPIIEAYKFKKYENNLLKLNTMDSLTTYKYLFDSLNLYNLRLAKMFSVNPINFVCYKFNNFAELNSSIGLDVQRNNSRLENNAYCDAINNVIYGTTDDCYFHELVHMYIGQGYLESCHIMINEGLATYLGGSGISLNQHLHYLSIDLKKHIEYDLNKFLDYDKKHIDSTTKRIWTNYRISIGGLLCKIVYEKQGFTSLKKLLSSGNKDEQLYYTVCQILNIKQKDLNIYLRQEIYKY